MIVLTYAKGDCMRAYGCGRRGRFCQQLATMQASGPEKCARPCFICHSCQGRRYQAHIQEVLATLDGDMQLRAGVWWLVPRSVQLDRAALAADLRAQRAAAAVSAVRARGRWRRAAHPHATVLSAHDLELLLTGQTSLSLQVCLCCTTAAPHAPSWLSARGHGRADACIYDGCAVSSCWRLLLGLSVGYFAFDIASDILSLWHTIHLRIEFFTRKSLCDLVAAAAHVFEHRWSAAASRKVPAELVAYHACSCSNRG